MELFTEQPVALAVLGVMFVVGSLVALLQTGLVKYLYLACGFALLTGLLLLVERNVVTPKEEIAATLEEIGRDLESNDVASIVRHISRTVPDVTASAEKSLNRVRIERVAVKKNLKVEFRPDHEPTSAVASFNAVIVISDRKGTLNNQLSPFFFEVDLVKEDGKWRVTRHKRHSPQTGLRQ